MAASTTLDESERELIANCPKALKTIPQIVAMIRVLFWMSVVATVVGVLVLLVLVATNTGSVEPETIGDMLIPACFWILLWGIALKAQKTELRLVQLVCKLTAENKV